MSQPTIPLKALDIETIEARLLQQQAVITGWALDANVPALTQTMVFQDFVDAMVFVNQVAELAETQNHHPDIVIRYNKVTLTLTTHDANGVTDRDFQLAAAINQYGKEGIH